MGEPLHLSPTSIAQYIHFENCERFLRFHLVPDEYKRLVKKWNLTIQPLTPLLKESGADFEKNIAEKLVARGETLVNLEKKISPKLFIGFKPSKLRPFSINLRWKPRSGIVSFPVQQISFACPATDRINYKFTSQISKPPDRRKLSIGCKWLFMLG